MRRKERDELRQALHLLYQEDGAGWEDAIRIIARLARVRVPSLEMNARGVSLEEIMKQPPGPFTVQGYVPEET